MHEYLRNKNYENLEYDYSIMFIRKNSWIIRLNSVLKSKRLGRIILYSIDNYVVSKIKTGYNHPYQPILEHLLKEVENILTAENELPDVLNNIQIQDTRNFDAFSGTSYPFFGENLIEVNSGLLFFSHLFARTFDQAIRFSLTGMKLNTIRKKQLNNRFKKTIVGYVTENHTKSLMWSGFLVPLNDFLLRGIELFIVAHEYAHLIYREKGLNVIEWSQYFNSEIENLILNDEEIAADAFAAIILCYIDQKSGSNTNELLLQGPSLFFNLSCKLEQEKLIPVPANHPSMTERSLYVDEIIKQLHKVDLAHIQVVINMSWNVIKKRVKRAIATENKKSQILREKVEEMFYYSFTPDEIEKINNGEKI